MFQNINTQVDVSYYTLCTTSMHDGCTPVIVLKQLCQYNDQGLTCPFHSPLSNQRYKIAALQMAVLSGVNSQSWGPF